MADTDDRISVGNRIVGQHDLQHGVRIGGGLPREGEHCRRRIGRDHVMPGVDEVAREQPAPAPELDDHTASRAHRLEQRQDAGRTCVGVEPETEVVDEGEITPVVRSVCHHRFPTEARRRRDAWHITP